MNRMIIDVNNNANRDIELINEATKRTKALINEANRTMESFKDATQRLRDMIAETDKLSSKSKRNVIFENSPLAEIPPAGTKRVTKNPYIDPNNSYQVVKKENDQPSLFDENISSGSILKDETKVTPEGAAYKEVPLIITKVFNDKPADSKIPAKALPEKVEKLFKSGMNVEEIAAELSCSISEVEFIIDML